jgi:hypothetical protein
MEKPLLRPVMQVRLSVGQNLTLDSGVVLNLGNVSPLPGARESTRTLECTHARTHAYTRKGIPCPSQFYAHALPIIPASPPVIW